MIESLHQCVPGKTRKAEYWPVRLVDEFEEARNLGVDEAVPNHAREKHTVAHQQWEWWTASNGHAFHNPDVAAAPRPVAGVALPGDAAPLAGRAASSLRERSIALQRAVAAEPGNGWAWALPGFAEAEAGRFGEGEAPHRAVSAAIGRAERQAAAALPPAR